MSRRVAAWLLGLSVVLAAAPRARAALGEPASSVALDAKALAATRRATAARDAYSVHELESAACVVREFVSPSGLVFAVAWQGVSEPDLSPLLGAYAGEYRTSLSETPRVHGRRSQQVVAAHVVVERWGHMRKLQGRAYVPALVPPGVKVDDLR